MFRGYSNVSSPISEENRPGRKERTKVRDITKKCDCKNTNIRTSRRLLKLSTKLPEKEEMEASFAKAGKFSPY